MCNFLPAERPLGNRNLGIAECVLRVREGDERTRQHLVDTFSKLFGIYGEGSRFEVVYTANAVLQGSLDNKLSVWFGQTFDAVEASSSSSSSTLPQRSRRGGGGGGSSSRPVNRQVDLCANDIVRNLGDVEYLPTQFDAEQFDRLYQANHEDSEVSVLFLINYVFIIRHFLDNYQLQHTTTRGRIQKLF
jgi:hypothetical protein